MSGNLHIAWAKLFVSSLISAGVQDFVLSPGSRSTPLVLAVAAAVRERPRDVRLHMILDERVAAFFALGQARVRHAPSALLCTSGTAGAHYLPAVIEAAQSHLPLLVLTADRPWEDYDAAAAQTIDQVKLFGGHVRHYAELGLPDASVGALRAVVRIAAQAVAAARSPRPGPVHVNARFRKPLEPITEAASDGRAAPPAWQRVIDELLARGAPRAVSSPQQPDPEAVAELARLCAAHPRGLLVCGPAWALSDGAELQASLLELAARTGFPLLAEATSGVRFGGGARVCAGFDALLRVPELRRRYRPELILEFGAPPVSAAYATLLGESSDLTRVSVAAHGWNDPTGSASRLLFGEPAAWAAALAAECAPLCAEPPRVAYRAAFAVAERAVWAAVDAELDATLSEGDVARAVVDALPPRATLLVGNSLPVRDLDTFCPAGSKPLTVLHQRGASGIDGLVSGAAGVRSVSDSPVALLVGDLSALHDVGGFGALRGLRGPLAVVIVQNGGGRIFAQLPIGQQSARSETAQRDFEALFITPQRADFASAAALFGLPFARVTSRAELEQALGAAMQSEQPLVIEAVVPAEDGTARRARLFARVAESCLPTSAPPAILRGVGSQDGVPQVYLHGFLGAPSLFAELAARRGGPYVAEYLPGHGPAPWLLPDADFDAVIDAMAAALPAPRCALVGYSMGSRLALGLAVRHPKRVASLTLIGVDPGLRSADERLARRAWEAELVQRLGTEPFDAFVADWESLPIFATQRRLEPQRLAQQRAVRLEHEPQAIAWALQRLGTGSMPALWSALSRLELPSLILTGALDTKFTAIGREMAATMPRARHVVVPNAGHNLLLEAPDAVFHAIHELEHEQSENQP